MARRQALGSSHHIGRARGCIADLLPAGTLGEGAVRAVAVFVDVDNALVALGGELEQVTQAEALALE